MKILFKNLKEYEKQFSIKFCKPKLLKHSNGFISVQLDWNNDGNDEFFNFKYPDLVHRSYGGFIKHGKRELYNSVTASFEFPDLKNKIEELNEGESYFPFWFDISIGVAKKNAFQEGYEYESPFFEKTKYGLICWFAPKGWEDWDNTKSFS